MGASGSRMKGVIFASGTPSSCFLTRGSGPISCTDLDSFAGLALVGSGALFSADFAPDAEVANDAAAPAGAGAGAAPPNAAAALPQSEPKSVAGAAGSAPPACGAADPEAEAAVAVPGDNV